jgi:radical SAM-linked protein
VVPPLPIPEFSGHFTPNQTKATRLRLRFSKQGDLTLISHLDLARLFDRAIRRASLPITYSGGFHPAPRIMIANALPLGASGGGEIVEFELTEAIDTQEFQDRFAAQLPSEISIYDIEAIDPRSQMASQLITKAAYVLTISNQGDYDWQKWIKEISDRSEFIYQKKTKSGKIRELDLRKLLFELELKEVSTDTAKIYYLGSCLGDGTTLSPENLMIMFEEISQRELELLHIHRVNLLID